MSVVDRFDQAVNLFRDAPDPEALKPAADGAPLGAMLEAIAPSGGPTARQLLAIFLVRRKGMKLREAAEMMKCRLQSVHMLLRRGDRRLRRLREELCGKSAGARAFAAAPPAAEPTPAASPRPTRCKCNKSPLAKPRSTIARAKRPAPRCGRSGRGPRSKRRTRRRNGPVRRRRARP